MLPSTWARVIRGRLPGLLSCPADRQLLKILRGLADVVLVGGGTAPPRTTARCNSPIVNGPDGTAKVGTCHREDSVDVARAVALLRAHDMHRVRSVAARAPTGL